MTREPGLTVGGAVLFLLLKLGLRNDDKRPNGEKLAEAKYAKRKTENNITAARKVLGVTWMLSSEIWV